MKKEIKIFIISPNDVKKERIIAKRVCEKLNEEVGDDRFKIIPIIWEDYPFRYGKNSQENIDHLLNQSDMYIVILWHRIGTVVEGYHGALTGEKEVTGTQYEIEKILSLGKEHVFFYFKREEPLFGTNELEEALRQQKELKKFIRAIELEQNTTKHGYHEFDSTDEFEQKIKKHLAVEIEKITGEKLFLKKPFQRGLFNAFHAFIFLWMMLIFVGIGYYLFVINAPYKQVKIENINMEENRQKQVKVYVTLQPWSNIFSTLLHQELIAQNIEIVKYKEKASYEIIVSYKSTEQEYYIAGEKMFNAKCLFSYDVVDLLKGKILNSYASHEDAMAFDSDKARLDCLQNSYKNLSKRLSTTMKGL